MSTDQVLDFTVTDLLGGGDDVRRLFTTDDPDGVWVEIVGWSRYRLTAALVAAVGIIQGEESANAFAGRGHGSSATGRPIGGQDVERTSPDGR